MVAHSQKTWVAKQGDVKAEWHEIDATGQNQVVVSGRKTKNKLYQTWSGYPSGRKLVPFNEQIDKNPESVLMLAVRRMLPKNKLGTKMLKKLKLYAGSEHPHKAQKPKPYTVTYGQKAGLEKAGK
jgi:ribosomal protein L13